MARKNKRGGRSLVTEATRIHVREALDQFQASDAKVYTFEAGLAAHDRAFVHGLCQKLGLISRSSGRGDQRCLSVYKIKKKAKTNKGSDDLPSLTFSKEAQDVLQDIFMQYPPEDGEEGKEMVGEASAKVRKVFRWGDDIFSKPFMSKEVIAEKVESLAYKVENDAKLRQVIEVTSKLPIASFRDVITSTLESHQVVLISGETGCGKTTQVPQYILDYMWAKGEACKIVCTQPRRLSAMSVAERIAYERGEQIGENIGYKVRLECKGGRSSSVVFCTNGLLLRVLVSKGVHLDSTTGSKKKGAPQMTHIIVDEIHERDRFSDIMLAIIRDMLPSNPHIRLIMMSATLDAERFSQYFGGCRIIRVPGFTYPVRTFYLEDVLSILKSEGNNHLDSSISCSAREEPELTEEDKLVLDEAINIAWSNDEFYPLVELFSSEGTQKVYNYQHSLTGLTPLMVFAGKGRVGEVCMLLSFGADWKLQTKEGLTALKLAEREDQQKAAEILKRHAEVALSDSVAEQRLLEKYLSEVNPELIDVVLIEQLLMKICTDSEDGAILVFFPGWDEINRTRDRLLSNRVFRDTSKFDILALHSMIPSTEQKKVFDRLPYGCRKIILSTNIAETAITIDDVIYVIDSGRVKEKNYDPYNHVSILQSSWVSKASARQREGRAGRCRPGICYHLYSKLQVASFADYQIPEIKRMPVEEICLQVKILDPDCKVDEFLQKTLDPPVAETIRNAVSVLQDIGALTHEEKLTELGEKLGSLPVHPVTSKMIFFAILMNCLDPALTLACAADYKDPFALPMLPHEKTKADACKAELASLYGGRSDQLAVVAAFECWKNAKERGQGQEFCSQYFISSKTMQMLARMRKQLQSELIYNGLIPEDVSSCSLNARDPGILHAVVMACLYPMVGRLAPSQKIGRKLIVETANCNKVRLHPKSSCFKLSLKKNSHPLVVYDEITRGDNGMFIRNCTVIGPLPLLLLSTEIAVAPASDDVGDDDDDNESDNDDESGDVTDIDNKSGGAQEDKIMSSPENLVKVVVDRWLYFGSRALDVAQIYVLRERLSAAILFKLKHPNEILPPVLAASVYAVACILSYDGLSGVSLPTEPVDSLTSMVNATKIGKSALEKGGPPQNTNKFLQSLFMSNRIRQDTHSRGRSRDPSNSNKNGTNLHGSDSPEGGSKCISKTDFHKRRRGNGAR